MSQDCWAYLFQTVVPVSIVSEVPSKSPSAASSPNQSGISTKKSEKHKKSNNSEPTKEAKKSKDDNNEKKKEKAKSGKNKKKSKYK